mgnify:CR=1 FL=1
MRPLYQKSGRYFDASDRDLAQKSNDFRHSALGRGANSDLAEEGKILFHVSATARAMARRRPAGWHFAMLAATYIGWQSEKPAWSFDMSKQQGDTPA